MMAPPFQTKQGLRLTCLKINIDHFDPVCSFLPKSEKNVFKNSTEFTPSLKAKKKRKEKKIIFRGKARENKYAKFKEVFRFLKTE